MRWRSVCWLHQNLPYTALKIWGSSPALVELSRKIAFGGNNHLKFLKLLKEMENWSKEKLYFYQSNMIKKSIQNAYDNVSYYRRLFRKAGLTPKDVKTPEDLKKIPLTDKEDFVKYHSQFFSRKFKQRNLVYRSTSGTSGKGTRFYYDSSGLSMSWASDFYFKKLLGYTMGKDNILHIPIVNQPIYMLKLEKLKHGSYTPVTKQIIFPSDDLNNKLFNKFVISIKKHKVEHIQGFPSVIFAFVNYLKKNNVSLKIKTVLCGSEMLYVHQRKFIEEELECEVFNRYGSSELTVRAYETPEHEGMLISPFGISETKENGFEGKGEHVMTNLVNRAFPLIRYNSNDIVTITQKPSKTGKPFFRMLDVEGRSNDFIILKDGTRLHSGYFAWITTELQKVKDMYFFQKKDRSLIVSVVKEKNASKKELKLAIEKSIKRITKNKLVFRIEFVEKIIRASRKFRVVESKAM